MSKKEYLDRLEELLGELPAEERSAAMEYYVDYLEDAGPEGEWEAMEKLGSPEQVAGAIREGIRGDENKGNWTENGYEAEEPGRKTPEKYGEAVSGEKDTKRRRSLGLMLLIVTGMICVGFPVLATVASVIFSLVVGVAAVSCGGFAVFLALLVAAVVLFSVAIAQLAVSPGTGAVLAGSGFFCVALAFVALAASVWIFGKVVPWLLSGIRWTWRRMFGRRENRE